MSERPSDTLLYRVSGSTGVVAAVLIWVFGLLHPKGSSDVGTLHEWLTRVGGSDVWVVVHFMLAVAAILVLVASVGIARSFGEGQARVWADLALPATIAATAVSLVTFLVDGPALKAIADQWLARPGDPATLGAGSVITEVGFILVAGLQISKGVVALLFGAAGVASRSHPAWPAWLAVVAGLLGLVPGSLHYLFGASTPTVSLAYVSEALFGVWVFAMSWRLWGQARSPVVAGTDRMSQR
jgi:hypothetical protein